MDVEEDERQGRAWRRLVLHMRVRLRQGSRRARWAFSPTLVAAAVAAIAYLISAELLGHVMPIFAPTAAWLCLGFTSDRQLRRVAELGVGCTLGVALGELFARLFGIGAIQIFAVLVVAALAARIVDRGELLTYQAGVQGVVVIAMPAGALSDGAFGRWTDALVGAALALFVAALLPGNAIRRPRRRAQAALTELADLLRTLAEALRLGDPELARDALTLGRDTQQVLDTWERTVRSARQVIALNPALRGDRPEMRRLARASVLADRAVRNARVVARKAESVLESGARPDLAASLEALSGGLRLLAFDLGRGDRPELSRVRIADAAHTLDPDDYQVEGWPTQTLVSVLRSLVVDVLQIAGMSAAGARAQLPHPDGQTSWADDEDTDGDPDESEKIDADADEVAKLGGARAGDAAGDRRGRPSGDRGGAPGAVDVGDDGDAGPEATRQT